MAKQTIKGKGGKSVNMSGEIRGWLEKNPGGDAKTAYEELQKKTGAEFNGNSFNAAFYKIRDAVAGGGNKTSTNGNGEGAVSFNPKATMAFVRACGGDFDVAFSDLKTLRSMQLGPAVAAAE